MRYMTGWVRSSLPQPRWIFPSWLITSFLLSFPFAVKTRRPVRLSSTLILHICFLREKQNLHSSNDKVYAPFSLISLWLENFLYTHRNNWALEYGQKQHPPTWPVETLEGTDRRPKGGKAGRLHGQSGFPCFEQETNAAGELISILQQTPHIPLTSFL